MSYNIYWFRNDLRIRDNHSLERACSESENLTCIYTLPKNYNELGICRKSFLIQSLYSLESQLLQYGLELYVTKTEELINVLSSFGGPPDKVYFSQSYNYQSKSIEQKVSQICNLESVSQELLFDTYPFKTSDTPKTFTKYRKLVEKSGRSLRREVKISRWPKNHQIQLKTISHWMSTQKLEKTNIDFKGGEIEGQKRLHYYLWESRCVESYKETRNGMLRYDDSSKLSPWLALGCISSAQVDRELQKYESGVCSNESTYWLYFEILWRDYFKLLGVSQGQSLFSISGIQNKNLELASNQKEFFRKWCSGNTENDFVNANMRELLETGWMSNRGRQNVASYLAKTLCIDWTWGAEWFEKNLIDYDVESNWGNWAYLAGVSVDPRDRRFNVERQAFIYDADESYRNKFLNLPG